MVHLLTHPFWSNHTSIKMASSLFKNAVNSIELGVEDFLSKDPRRVISAVRNFYAGVLLLLKEKLVRESPPDSNNALLYQRIVCSRNPSGEVRFGGKGEQTADVRQIKERFKNLELALDVNALNKLKAIRNNVEHYSLKVPKARARAAIAETFQLAATVLVDHLEEKPAEIFDIKTWQTMLTETETFRSIEQRCEKSFKTLTDVPSSAVAVLPYLTCPECDSSLLEVRAPSNFRDSKFVCCACGNQCEIDQVIGAAVEAAYTGDSYEAIDPPIGICPHCVNATFHIEDDECLTCGESREYTECLRCKADLSLDEQGSGQCSYCEHMCDR